MRNLPLFIAACVAVAFIGCTTAPTTTGKKGAGGKGWDPGSHAGAQQPVASGVSAAEAKEYKEIQNYFGRGLYEPVIQKSQAYLKKYSRSPQLPAVENLYGLALLLTNRALQAIPHFKRSAEGSGDNRIFRQYILYNLAKAQFDSSQFEDCQQSLAEIALDALDRDNRLKVHFLKSRLYLKLNIPLSAREALIASRLMSRPRLAKPEPLGNQWSKRCLMCAQWTRSKALYRESADAPYADHLLYRLVTLQMALGNSGSAESMRKNSSAVTPVAPLLSLCAISFQPPLLQSYINPRVVGVMLPLKGKWAKFGQRSLQAARDGV